MKAIIKIMKPRKLFSIFLLTILLFAIFVIGANAQLDPTFGTNGVTSLNVNGTNKPLGSYLLSDGKILVVNASLFVTNSSAYKLQFVRFNSNGTVDTSFGTNGIAQVLGTDSQPLITNNPNCARQTDGKILIVGSQSVYRYNENGTLDTTFSGDGVHTPNVDQQASKTVNAVVQQTDGKIIAAGTIISPYPESRPVKIFFVRYDSNGNLDTTFGDQGGFIINNVQYASLSEIALQSDGKILTVPEKEATPNTTYYGGAINRFNSNGTIDGGFSPIFFSGGSLRSFKLLRDDRFVVAGSLTINDALLRTQKDITISRYTAYGILDTSFGVNGTLSFDVSSSMIDDAVAIGQQGNGKLIISGVTSIQPNRSTVSGLTQSLIRINAKGTIDGKYLSANLANYYNDFTPTATIYPGQILIQPDGKVISVSVKLQNDELFLTRSTGIPLETNRFHGIPYSFVNINFASPSIYRPSNRNWYFNPVSLSTFFGLSDDVLAPADFVGDFRTDLAVFRPSDGTWYISRDYFNPAQNFISIRWGKTGDIPIPRDYDGDSKADIAVFRPENGVWYRCSDC